MSASSSATTATTQPLTTHQERAVQLAKETLQVAEKACHDDVRCASDEAMLKAAEAVVAALELRGRAWNDGSHGTPLRGLRETADNAVEHALVAFDNARDLDEWLAGREQRR